jgi:hypothetical protein
MVFLPAYSPELNPVERLWQDLRGRMAWCIFDDLDGLEAELCTQLKCSTPAVVQSLTSYRNLVHGKVRVSSVAPATVSNCSK